MKDYILKLSLILVVFAVPWTSSFAQPRPPFDVEYTCEGDKIYTGKLDFSLCSPPSSGSDGYKCYFGTTFPTATYPKGVGEGSVGATFHLRSPNPGPRRKVCLFGAGAGIDGDINGPLPFVASGGISGHDNPTPKRIKDCAVWISVGKTFRIDSLAYDLGKAHDYLYCELVIKNFSE